MDFFFYGTLMDEEVRRAVLRRALPAARLQAASLGGYRRVCMAGAPYPVLVASAADDRVDGLLARGLSAADSARLLRYEGFAYLMKMLPVEIGAARRVNARVFLPRGNVRITSDPWTLSEWQRERRGAPAR